MITIGHIARNAKREAIKVAPAALNAGARKRSTADVCQHKALFDNYKLVKYEFRITMPNGGDPRCTTI